MHKLTSFQLWMAIFLHTIGVEIYLNLTPAEADRLRLISWAKQLSAGLPRDAGLTVQKYGDARPWVSESIAEDRRFGSAIESVASHATSS